MQDGVTVRDVMSREFLGVSESDDIGAVLDVMLAESVPSVVVLRGSAPVGIINDLDILEVVSGDESLRGRSVDEVMQSPPEPLDPDQDVGVALDRLTTDRHRQLPVTDDDDALVGILSESDVLTAATSLFSAVEQTGEDEPTPLETTPGPSTGNTMASSSRTTDLYSETGHAESEQTRTNGAGRTGETTSTQGVCESCGSLVDELGDFNGQLRCRECRDV